MIVVINYGGQYCHLIARRVRDFNVYSEILPYNVSLKKIKKLNPDGIILSGGPSSVYDAKAPISREGLLKLGIPVLGICYGQQLIAKQLEGEVVANKIKEYGKKIEYKAHMLPQTDDILSCSVNISVGVVDPGIGAHFGINILSSDDEIKQVAGKINDILKAL